MLEYQGRITGLVRVHGIRYLPKHIGLSWMGFTGEMGVENTSERLFRPVAE